MDSDDSEEESGEKPFKEGNQEKEPVPSDFKKIKNPTYLAESFQYMMKQDKRLSKDFNKASIFKTKKARNQLVL